MRRRALAVIGNQSHTLFRACTRKIRMSPDASALYWRVPRSPTPSACHQHEEVESRKVHHLMLSNTLPGVGYSCSEPEITPITISHGAINIGMSFCALCSGKLRFLSELSVPVRLLSAAFPWNGGMSFYVRFTRSSREF